MRNLSPTALAAAVSLALLSQGALAQARAGTAARTTPGVNATAPATAAGGSQAASTAVTGNNPQGNPPQGNAPPNVVGQSSNTITFIPTQQGVVAIGTPIAGSNAAGASTGQTPASTASLQGAQLVDANGRVLTNANGKALTLDARGVIGVAPFGVDSGVASGMPDNGNAQVVILNPNDLAGSVTSTPELDRATLKELNKARIVSRSRNKQMLHTIAPRTNADRTDQMADDPRSPALSTPERSLPRY